MKDIYFSSITLTTHSRMRASQRAISKDVIGFILENGIVFYRQGLSFYTLYRKSIRNELQKKMSNVVLVVNEVSNELVTCYKCKNAIKHLTRKDKILR